jgi:hypothetical protein
VSNYCEHAISSALSTMLAQLYPDGGQKLEPPDAKAVFDLRLRAS